MRACVRACVRACACACVHVCVNGGNVHVTCIGYCSLTHSGETSDSDDDGKTKGSSKEGYGGQRGAGLGLAGGPSSSVSTNTPPGLLTGPSRRRPRSRRCVSEMFSVLQRIGNS